MTTDPASNNIRAYSSRIGLMADSPNFPAEWNQVMEKVRIADELGYDSIWLGESWGYELFTSMADLVRVTKRIKIGAGIANIYSRTPALIASTIATLDERSGGRMLLGLGPSGANVIEHWHGVPFQKPVQRTREYVEIIRMILRGEKLVYHGEMFNLERGFKLRFTPPRTNIPIYIAAMGPKNVVQSGEISDGVLPVYWQQINGANCAHSLTKERVSRADLRTVRPSPLTSPASSSASKRMKMNARRLVLSLPHL